MTDGKKFGLELVSVVQANHCRTNLFKAVNKRNRIEYVRFI